MLEHSVMIVRVTGEEGNEGSMWAVVGNELLT